MEMEEVALVIGQVSKMGFTQSSSNYGHCEMSYKNPHLIHKNLYLWHSLGLIHWKHTRQ